MRLATLLALVLASAPARAAEPRLDAYLEGVRFDLDTLRFLPAGRDDGPRTAEDFRLPTPVGLRGVRGEVVAFQILVTGAPGAHPVRVTRTSSVGPEVQVFQALPVEIEEASTSDFVHPLGPGTYPGPLAPADTATVPEQGGAMLFVDLFVPPGTPAGEHAGEIRVGQASLPYRLEVLDIELTDVDRARLGAVNFGSLLARGNEDLAVERAWMRLAHAHYLSVEIMRPTPTVEAGEIDWAGWAERVGPYVDGSAFTAKEGYRGPRAGLPTARFVAPFTDWWPTPATEDRMPEDPERWSRALREWERFVEGQGWFDLPQATTWILFVNSLDEPHDPETVESLAAYGPLLEAAELEDRNHILFRVDGNWGQKIEGYDDARQAEALGPVVDLWNVHGAPYTIPWGRLVKRRREHEERVMAYFSNSSGEPSIPPTTIDTPLAGLLAWGWIVARYDLEGLLNWEVDYFAPECATNPRCSPGGQLNLDANLIFRAEAFGGPEGEPWPSLRLKALRRGAQDAALLSMLEASAPDTAGLIAAAVVPHALGDQVPPVGTGAWSMDPRTYARARAAVLDRLAGVDAPFPLEEIRQDPLPRWAWHFERWAVAIGMAIVGFAGLLYIIKK